MSILFEQFELVAIRLDQEYSDEEKIYIYLEIDDYTFRMHLKRYGLKTLFHFDSHKICPLCKRKTLNEYGACLYFNEEKTTKLEKILLNSAEIRLRVMTCFPKFWRKVEMNDA